MFEPEFSDDVESGDMFACSECHEFVSADQQFCPDCHVGICEGCGIAVAHNNIGERDFVVPEIIYCRACYLHGNDIHSLCDHGVKVPFLVSAIRQVMRPELTQTEKVALSLLR